MRQDILDMINEGRADEAIAMLDSLIANCADNAELHYLRGRAYWKKQDWKHAVTDYETAAQLDCKSPAAAALEMAREVLNFYSKDLLNP